MVPPSSGNAAVEQWNGSSWTEVGDLNTARYGGIGSQFNYDNSFIAGKVPLHLVLTANTELWNGASWAEVADLSTC